MTLLVLLSWFLLLLSIILSCVVLASMLLRMKHPEAAKFTSWVALFLGLLAVLVVIITTGYLETRHVIDEEPCAAFGLKNNPNAKNRNVSDIVLISNYLLTNFPEIDKWSPWVIAGLCGIAVLAFVVCVTLLFKDNSKKIIRKISLPKVECFRKDTIKVHLIECDKKGNQMSPNFVPEPHFFKPKKSPQHMWASYAALTLLCMALIGVILLNYFGKEEAIEPPCVGYNHPSAGFRDSLIGGPENSQNHTYSSPHDLYIIPRKEWLAKPPKSTKALKHPVGNIVISRTNQGSCSSRSNCTKAIRYLQIIDMDLKGWWDITPNFLVAGDDQVYEGRGWDVAGFKDISYKNGSITVSFVGNVIRQAPNPYQIMALRRLIEEGIRIGKILPSYKLVMDRKAISSMLQKELQNWYRLQ